MKTEEKIKTNSETNHQEINRINYDCEQQRWGWIVILNVMEEKNKERKQRKWVSEPVLWVDDDDIDVVAASHMCAIVCWRSVHFLLLQFLLLS